MNLSHCAFIARFSADFATKSRGTRTHFSRTLQKNIRAALARSGVRARTVQAHDRLFVFASEETAARAALARVFGLANFSRIAARCSADPAEMARTVERFRPLVEGRRYAVRARRRGNHDFSSVDVERCLGAVLNANATVDLENPEITVHVEILDGRAYFFTERDQGAGGLPLGTSGRALALLSGGFDSAVAAWRMMRRGIAVDFLFCNLAGGAYERQVIQVAKVLTDLWAFGTRPWLFVVDFADVVDELKARVEPRLWQVVLKRLMYRAAASAAGRCRAEAIITGEAISQVSSQTLANLKAIEPAAEMIVLRPLLGLDKSEIMAQAHRIGTALLSEKIPEYCALSGPSPAVQSTARKVGAQEAAMDPGVLERALAGMRRIDLAEVTGDELRSDYLFVDDIPEDAQLIDCQPPAHYRHWHLPGAVNRAPEDIVRNLRRFDKRRCYVLYCPFGTQSAHLAEIMQQHGYQAYALRGGIGAIRKRQEAEMEAALHA